MIAPLHLTTPRKAWFSSLAMKLIMLDIFRYHVRSFHSGYVQGIHFLYFGIHVFPANKMDTHRTVAFVHPQSGLASQKAKLNAKRSDGHTAMHIAIQNRKVDAWNHHSGHTGTGFQLTKCNSIGSQEMPAQKVGMSSWHAYNHVYTYIIHICVYCIYIYIYLSVCVCPSTQSNSRPT